MNDEVILGAGACPHVVRVLLKIGLRVRSGASTATAKIVVLPKGTFAYVAERRGDWLRITSYRVADMQVPLDGWIMARSGGEEYVEEVQ